MSDTTGSNPQRANTSMQKEYYHTDPYSTIKVLFCVIYRGKKESIMGVDTRFAS